MSDSPAAGTAVQATASLRREGLAMAGLAAATGLGVLIHGYRFGISDQTLYLPFVYHWRAPTLFPSDYLLTLGYAKDSVTWVMVTALSRWIDLRAVLLFLYLGAAFFTLHFIRRTALHLWGSGLAAWVAVLLWLPAYEVPGAGIDTVDAYFTTRCLAMALGAAALYVFLKGKPGTSGTLLAVMVLVHVVTALPLAAGFGLALLLERRWRGLVGLVWRVGAAGLLLTIGTTAGGAHHEWIARFDPGRFHMLMQVAAEVFPQGWHAAWWVGLGLLAAALLVVTMVEWRCRPAGDPVRRLLAVAWGACLAGLFGLAGAGAGVAILAQLNLNRGFVWMVLALTLWAAHQISQCLEDERWTRRAAGLYLMAAWLTGTLALAAACLLLLPSPSRDPVQGRAGPGWQPPPWLPACALIVLLLLQAYWAVRLPALGLDWPASGLPLAVIFAAVALGVSRLAGGSPARPSPAALGVGMLAAVLLIPPAPALSLLGVSPVLAGVLPSVRAAVRSRAAREEEEAFQRHVARMVGRRVPREATVLVPADWAWFRTRTFRSSFVTIKDGCGLLYDGGFFEEWTARMQAVGALRADGSLSSEDLPRSPADLSSLARRYARTGLGFFITRQECALPLVDSAAGWRLYRLDGGPSP